MKCFIDTSALLAVLNRDDENHAVAALTWRQLLTGDWQLVTSSYVLVEAFALCQNRLGIQAAKALQNDIVPILEIIWIDTQLHTAAANAVIAAGKRKLSLVDCASFEIMRDKNISKAFAFDSHFAEQGFALLNS